jgi:hypothetical protein
LGNGVQIDPVGFCKRIFAHSLWRGREQNRARSCFTHLNASRNRPDTVGLPVDLPNDVVLRVGDEEVSLCIESETFRLI